MITYIRTKSMQQLSNQAMNSKVKLQISKEIQFLRNDMNKDDDLRKQKPAKPQNP